ncbi:hypothetical protein [Criblamydia sequanensis]|uniref:Uncharacterized protein n=1 Tax=Candidatus Criblamydia sequanensis CRIB-18 TaxID=1437425 RepID=A0A090CZY3_9BACT|nr:hypothetical protein [Criblamydia sequanensis]CDR33100.1 hypothetical protein CSEC_0261 [Criblamydia sequanensis CRIB-18]
MQQTMTLSGSLSPGLLTSLLAEDTKNIKELEHAEAIIQHSLEGLKAFKSGNLKSLDAGVGDQACQIRAITLSSFYKDLPKSNLSNARKSLKKSISSIRLKKEKIEKLKKKAKKEMDGAQAGYLKELDALKSVGKEKRTQITSLRKKYEADLRKIKDIESQLQEKVAAKCSIRKVDVVLDRKIAFILLCYLVARIKVTTCDQYKVAHDRDSMKLFQITPLSYIGPLVEKIIAKARVLISKYSVEEVKEMAKNLHSKSSHRLEEIVSDPKETKKGLLEVPFYYGTKVLFKKAKELTIPILLKIRQREDDPLNLLSYNVKLAFKPDNEGQYAPVKLSEVDEGPIIVIESASIEKDQKKVEEYFSSFKSIIHFIDCSTAQHGQYTVTGIELPLTEKEIEKMDHLKKEAIETGMTMEDARICAIEHIYANLFSNEMGDL